LVPKTIQKQIKLKLTVDHNPQIYRPGIYDQIFFVKMSNKIVAKNPRAVAVPQNIKVLLKGNIKK